MQADWWTEKDGIVTCLLCPHSCVLTDMETGLCAVREARGGVMHLPAYGMITAAASDPVEKKPLYHFHPGEKVWSIGFAGCNMLCPFCQNHSISRADSSIGTFKTPETVIAETKSAGSDLLAFTYSEPTVHYEYLIETAELARQSGLKTILVSNGNINRKPARKLLPLMDAVNIDLKSWNKDYYQKKLGGSLETVKTFIRESVKFSWVELTTLIIPGDNDYEDDIRNMSRWIASVSGNIPLHLSAYHPAYRYRVPGTGVETMEKMKSVAEEKLSFVYIGNMGVENDTYCPVCSEIVVERNIHITESLLDKGCCRNCGTEIPGVFPDYSVPDSQSQT